MSDAATQPPGAVSATASPTDSGSGQQPITERPEALVGGAFAGGLLAALLLRKIVG